MWGGVQLGEGGGGGVTWSNLRGGVGQLGGGGGVTWSNLGGGVE